MNALFRLSATLILFSASLVSNAQSVKVTPEIVYTESVDPKTNEKLSIKLDAYLPEPAKDDTPAVICVHGGGWTAGDKSGWAAFARTLAENGIAAFSINYRFAPKFHHPAQLDDTQKAVRWIRAHASEYHINKEKLGAIGDSAGAHLVAFLGTRETRDNSDMSLSAFSSRVKCVVALYPPTDFTVQTEASKANPVGIALLNSFFGKKPGEDDALYKDGSPLAFVDKASSPFLIFHGDSDPLVPIEQSKRLHEALKKVGVESTLVIFANEGHGFQKPASLETVNLLALAFFKRNLK